MTKSKKSKEKLPVTPFQRIVNIITTVMIVIFVLLAVLLAGVRLIGLKPFCVLGGSMEPTFHVGSLIYVKSVDPEDVSVGDPITFVLNEDLVVATHKVVRIDAENECFYTKGEANETEDGDPVHFKNLIGKPVFSIPYLGYVSAYISSPPGTYVCIAAAILLIILMFIPDITNGKRKKQAINSEAEATDAAPDSKLTDANSTIEAMGAAQAASNMESSASMSDDGSEK